jgi:hypothetical protein
MLILQTHKIDTKVVADAWSKTYCKSFNFKSVALYMLTKPITAEAPTPSALTQHFRKVLLKAGKGGKGTPKSDKKSTTTKKLTPSTPTTVKRTIDKTPPSKKRKVVSMSEEDESEPDVTNFDDAGRRASIPRRSKSVQPKYADDDGADDGAEDGADSDEEDAGGKKFVAHKYTNFDPEDDTEDDWENNLR